MTRLTPFAVLVLVLAGCSGDERPDGRYHETLCRVPFINEDFLTGALDQDWRERSPGRGSYAVHEEGVGADREGWLVLDSQGGDVDDGDRSAYGLEHVAPSEGFHLRALLSEIPAGPSLMAGLLAEQDRDSLVAVVLRGTGGGLEAELLAYEAGSATYRSDRLPVSGPSILVELIRDIDSWTGFAAGTELGTTTLALPRHGLDAAVVAGSADGSPARLRVEWIDACPYYRDR